MRVTTANSSSGLGFVRVPFKSRETEHRRGIPGARGDGKRVSVQFSVQHRCVRGRGLQTTRPHTGSLWGDRAIRGSPWQRRVSQELKLIIEKTQDQVRNHSPVFSGGQVGARKPKSGLLFLEPNGLDPTLLLPKTDPRNPMGQVGCAKTSPSSLKSRLSV